MGNNQLIVVNDGSVRISQVLNDCISLCVPTYKNESLSSILQKLCTRIEECCGSGGSDVLIEAGDNITITGSGTTTDPWIINADGGGGQNFFTLDTNSVDLEGDGAAGTPLYAQVRRDPAANNALIITPNGLLVPNTIESGIVYGGIVTWLGDYDYHISAAGYWIDFQFYESPAADFTLSPPDATFNRIDTFVLTTNEEAGVLEGTPSNNPAQAPIDPVTQLAVSVALVEVGTTEPSISSECIYRNNLEWTATSSNTTRLNPDSTAFPCNSVKALEGTGVVDADNILFDRGSSFFPTTQASQLNLFIRPKGSFGSNGLIFQWELGGVVVGDPVSFNHLSYFFDSLDTGTCQLIAIPLFHFGLTDLSEVDSFRITGEVVSGTIGFYIDDLCIQGMPLPPQATSVDNKFKIDSADSEPGTFTEKITAGSGIAFNIVTDSEGYKTLEITTAVSDNLTFDNGLTRTLDNTQWGGTLLHDTVIDADIYTIDFLGTHDTQPILTVTNFGTDNAIDAVSQDGTAVFGSNTGGNPAVFGFASGAGTAVLGQSLLGTGGEFQASAPGETALLTSGPIGAIIRSFDSDDNGVVLQSEFMRTLSSGTALAGFGAYMSLTLEADDNLVHDANRIVWEWSDPDATNLSSTLSFTGVNSGGTQQTQLSLLATGQMVAPQYGSGNFTGTDTFWLAVTATGEIIEMAAPAGASITADNGLNMDPATNVQLGGTLIENTDIELDSFIFQMMQSGQPFLKIDPTTDAEFSSLLAYNVTGATNMAEYRATTSDIEADWQIQSRFDGNSTSAIIEGTSNASTSFIVYQANSHEFRAELTVADNTVIPTITLYRTPSSFIANDGLGQSIDFLSATTTTSRIINQIISTLVESTDASRSSELSFTVVNSAVDITALTLLQTGQLQLPEYDTALATFTGTPTFLLAVDTNGNVIQTSLGAASGITADNGLTMSTATNAQLGGTLLHDTTIDNDIYELEIIGTNAAHLLRVTNSGSGTGIHGISNSTGAGVRGTTVDYYGVLGEATGATAIGVYGSASGALGTGVVAESALGGVGLYAISQNGVAGKFLINPASTATLDPAIVIQRSSTGTPANGIGAYISFDMTYSAGLTSEATRFASKWTNVSTRTSSFEWYLKDTNVLAKKMSLKGEGQLILDEYGAGTFTGTETYLLASDASGNIIEVDPSAVGGAANIYTVDNGLTETPSGNFKLGGVLDAGTTSLDGFTNNGAMSIDTMGNASSLTLNNFGNGRGLSVNTSGSGVGVEISSSGGKAIRASSNEFASEIRGNYTTSGNVETVLEVVRAQGGANGTGGSLDFLVQGESVSPSLSHSLISKWTDYLIVSKTSEFSIQGYNSAVLETHLTLAGTGALQLNNYGSGAFTGTPTYVLTTDASGNIIESALGTGGLTAITADNGLTANTSSNVRLGGTLLADTTVDGTGSYHMRFTSSVVNNSTDGTLTVANTGAGQAIYASSGAGNAIKGLATSGIGVFGTTTSGVGVQGNSSSGNGVQGYSVTSRGGQFTSEPATTNSVVTVVRLSRSSTGTPVDGIGGALEFFTNTSTSGDVSTTLISKWTTAADATRTSQFIITGVDTAVEADLFTLSGNGAARLNNYGAGTITAGAPTFALNVDANGNIIEAAIGAGMTNPMGAIGDIITSSDGAGTPVAIGPGAAGTVLTSNGVGFQPTWQAAGGAAGISRTVVTTAAPLTMGSAALTDYVYFVSGTTTVTLPTAVGNTNRYTVFRTDASLTTTIATSGGQTINGSSTVTLTSQYEAVDLVSNGSQWFII